MNLTEYILNHDPKRLDDDYNNTIKQMSNEIISESSDKILIGRPFDQIASIIIQARFADSDDECMNVINLMDRYMKKGSLPYFLDEEDELDFGSKCLMSLSFYYKALEKRSNRRGAPKPEFYRDMGKTVLKENGMRSVSRHFRQWENFLGDYFPRKVLK